MQTRLQYLTMSDTRLLQTSLSFEPGWMTVALFSQQQCAFCEEVREHYLKPMRAARRAGIAFAEFELNGMRRVVSWAGRSMTEAEFARERGAKFAPTVMFFGTAGESLAPTIVGLSRDFFGAYLDERIQIASKAVG